MTTKSIFLVFLIEQAQGLNLCARYISLLNECYSAFSSVRQKLIIPIIQKRMNELAATGASTNKDLVKFSRNGINFVRNICMDEFELFCAFFSGERSDSEA